LATSGKQKNWGCQPRQPDVATDVKTTAARQHDIEDDQIEGKLVAFFEALFPIGEKSTT